MFVFCSYWRIWDRVIANNFPTRGSVAVVNLTPIPAGLSSSWDRDVKPIRFRNYLRWDPIVEDLPSDVRALMVKNLGEDLTNRLLTEDFFPQIDWARFTSVCNAGANLADCCR